VLLSGWPEQRTGKGETMRYDVARREDCPNMIVLGKDCPTT